MNPQRYAKLITLLLKGDYNCKELAQVTGMHYITVLEYTRALHLAAPVNLIYICRWERDARGRDAIMVYKFGPGEKDVPRRVLGRTEQQRRYRERQRIRAMQARDEQAVEVVAAPSWPFNPTPRAQRR